MCAVAVTGDDEPLSAARVTLYLRSGATDRQLRKETSTRGGAVRFKFSRSFHVVAVSVEPAYGYWPMLVRGPRNSVSIACPPLPQPTGRLGWLAQSRWY